MPHVERYFYDNVRLPSVSTITGTLAKDGIIRWQRKLGFEEADRQSYVAARQGTKVATMFEKYRKRGRKPRAEYLTTVLNEWVAWGEGWKDVKLIAEPHLFNTKDMYHGSPDLVFFDSGKWSIGDDKSKKRFADYGLLMNEHAYASCNMMDLGGGKSQPVPWDVPIQDIWFWTYSPSTGKLYPHHHQFDPKVYADFLVCRQMYEVNRTASKYFDQKAILLPEADNETK